MIFQVQYVKDIKLGHSGGTLVTCIAITSGIGRIIFGKVADHPNVNGIALQQLSFISIGVCTMLLTAAPYFTVTTFVADLSVRDFWILVLLAELRCFIPVGIGSRKLVFWVKMKKTIKLKVVGSF